MQPNINHFATSRFWIFYSQLPEEMQNLADKNYELLRANPKHPSLHFQKVRVGKNSRALGFEETEGIVWFWIGAHEEYEKFLKKST